jgi:Protein of unknown function (DUF3299)
MTASLLRWITTVAAFGAACAALPADPAATLPVKAAPAVLTKDGYLKAGFDVLGSFDFTAPNEDGAPASDAAVATALAQIPPRIQALDGSRVMVTGYMLPLKLNGNRVSEFLLVSSPMLCCYGTVPQMNNWVIVRMSGAGVPILMDSPIQFFGRLHVGKVVEGGALAGIFLLDGERMGDGQD